MAKGGIRMGGEERGDNGYVCEVDASKKGRKVPEVRDGRCEDLDACRQRSPRCGCLCRDEETHSRLLVRHGK